VKRVVSFKYVTQANTLQYRRGIDALGIGMWFNVIGVHSVASSHACMLRHIYRPRTVEVLTR